MKIQVNVTVNIYNTDNNCNQVPDDTIVRKQERLADDIKGRRQPWKQKKNKSVNLSYAMHELGEHKKANRVYWCGEELSFVEDPITGNKKLKSAYFCRERLCVMCSWRKSIKTFYQLSNVFDDAQEADADLKFVFLTLTVKNCSGSELSGTLDAMFKGWYLMTKHRRFTQNFKGWFRALEVTYNHQSDTYHPHFHAVLAVDKSYFQINSTYVRTEDWVHMWRTSCKLDYDPVCDIRAVKSDKNRNRKHVAEVSKYTVKDADYIHDDSELTVKVVDILGKSLHKRRLFAYGGILKEIYKKLNLEDPEKSDLINVGEDATMREDVADALMVYKWDFGLKDYFRRV